MTRILLGVIAALVFVQPAAADPRPAAADRALERALDRLVEAKAGPPGAISVIQRGDDREVHTAGVAAVGSERRIRANDHMRLASASKAWSGAAILVLVEQGALALDESITARVPGLPAEWAPVTIAQILQHTSGLPDYSGSDEFRAWIVKNLHSPIEPRALLDFIADPKPEFTPGTAYQYSNTDNIVAGLIVEAVTQRSYEDQLATSVFAPLDLTETTLPSDWRMPDPYLRGYDVDPPAAPEDVSELASMASLWAAGGMVSTPADVTRFIRGYVGRKLFSRTVQRQQFSFVEGESQPPGPGDNAAGLSVFRYRTRCGTLYGHTGNVFGYTQFMAASADGKRSVTVSASVQLSRESPAVEAFAALRKAFAAGACAALARPRGSGARRSPAGRSASGAGSARSCSSDTAGPPGRLRSRRRAGPRRRARGARAAPSTPRRRPSRRAGRSCGSGCSRAG